MVILSDKRFRLGVFLLFLVAVLFLIGIIATYIYYLSQPGSEDCEALCCAHWDQKKDKDQILYYGRSYAELESNLTVAKRSISQFEVSLNVEEAGHPLIGALLENLYLDDKEEIFRCAAVIVASEWALTVDDCLSYTLSIRTGSSYWSEGGTTRTIRNVRKNTNLVLINFDKVNASEAEIGKLDGDVTAFNWMTKLSLPLGKRAKFEKLTSFKMERFTQNCTYSRMFDDVSCFVTKKNQFCGDKINAPLVNKDGRFVGILLEIFCEENTNFAYAFYVDFYPHRAWIQAVTHK